LGNFASGIVGGAVQTKEFGLALSGRMKYTVTCFSLVTLQKVLECTGFLFPGFNFNNANYATDVFIMTKFAHTFIFARLMILLYRLRGEFYHLSIGTDSLDQYKDHRRNFR